VQNLIQLSDGSALKLTIARYYTPKGVCIEGQGITPDVEVKLPEDEAVIPTEEKDLQFQKALEEVKSLIGEQNK
ncbi:MAG TPA: S41 family peptidase, partial [bacterium]|nr:S41 family peptidase [bacterium]